MAAQIRFPNSIGLKQELNRRVEAHLESVGRAPRDNPEMFVKTVVILAWVAAAYAVAVVLPVAWWLKPAACVLLGAGLAGMAMSIGHDGNHEAYSKNKTVNFLMGLAFDFVGASSCLWRFRHNIIHHTYTNIARVDFDISSTGDFIRLTSNQRYFSFHRFQQVYSWFLYCFLAFDWLRSDVSVMFASQSYLDHEVPPPSRKDKLLYLFLKIPQVSYVFVVPFALGCTWWQWLIGAVLTYCTLGFILAVTFQLAHVVDGASFVIPADNQTAVADEWAVHQLKTTVDFAPRSGLLNWYLGGLNYQALHHLFPRMCHVNYPHIRQTVIDVCRDFGVEYRSYPTLREALGAHYRHLRNLGLPPEAGARLEASRGPRRHDVASAA